MMEYHDEALRGMTDAEAREYLYAVLSRRLTAEREAIARTRDNVAKHTGVNLTFGQAALFALLFSGRGRTLTQDHLTARLQELGAMDDPVDIKLRVFHLRHALRQTKLPLRIESDRGLGYRMIGPKNWLPPWGKATTPVAVTVRVG